MMQVDVLSHFGRLDELIQIVYQGFDRFVVISQVIESAWTIHLGLKGPGGRWWRGATSAQDILGIVVRLFFPPAPFPILSDLLDSTGYQRHPTST
ncbi:hypothetical protein M404DRAFT_1000616, partial [Pisolithus tinctorius Marx 270]